MKHLTTAIQQALADLEKGDTLCEINAAHILRQALAAASAVLTEPAVVAKVSHKGAAKWDVEFTWPVGKFEEDGDHKLYTEQQVRAMLATGWHHRKPNCITCNDRGAVGNILTAEPCPDCTPPQVQADALDAGVQRDAERYRWLRKQHWNEGVLCVVAQPKKAVKLGCDCPSIDRLDGFIDAARAAQGGV